MNRDFIIKMARQRGEPEWLIERRVELCDEHESAPTPNFQYGLGVSLPASQIGLPDGEPTAADAELVGESGLRLEPFAPALAEAPIFDAWLAFTEQGDGRPVAVSAWQEAWGVGERLLRVPSGWFSNEPIRLNVSSAAGTAAHRLIVDAGESARVTLIVSSATDGLLAQELDIFARPGAVVSVIALGGGKGSVWNGHRVCASVGAHVTLSTVQVGGSFAMNRVRARLDGIGAAFCGRSAYVGSSGSLFDDDCLVAHESSDTHSDLKSAAVLGRSDKAVSRARLSLASGVSDSTARQRADALLLADGAEFAAWPEFSARHDLIQCAHGAAVSGLDEDGLFYLMSRGLTRDEAAATLAESFLAPHLSKMREAGLNDEIADIIGKVRTEIIYAER